MKGTPIHQVKFKYQLSRLSRNGENWPFVKVVKIGKRVLSPNNRRFLHHNPSFCEIKRPQGENLFK